MFVAGSYWETLTEVSFISHPLERPGAPIALRKKKKKVPAIRMAERAGRAHSKSTHVRILGQAQWLSAVIPGLLEPKAGRS